VSPIPQANRRSRIFNFKLYDIYAGLRTLETRKIDSLRGAPHTPIKSVLFHITPKSKIKPLSHTKIITIILPPGIKQILPTLLLTEQDYINSKLLPSPYFLYIPTTETSSTHLKYSTALVNSTDRISTSHPTYFTY